MKLNFLNYSNEYSICLRRRFKAHFHLSFEIKPSVAVGDHRQSDLDVGWILEREFGRHETKLSFLSSLWSGESLQEVNLILRTEDHVPTFLLNISKSV